MVEIIKEKKLNCKCDNCKSKLSYTKEDVKTRLLTRGPCDYGGDACGTEETWIDYIVCPVCGEEIIIRFREEYR